MNSGSPTPCSSTFRLPLSPPSVSSAVKPSVPPSDSGSALVLVLLITALLSTIAVSFLSTSRVEQIAAKNFSRQNAAAGLAELATQQAIANLNSAFNASGNVTGNYTAIVTSQPGRIQKFFFQNGTYSKNSTDLFFSSNSTNANGTVNLNNLNNSTTSAIAGLITGNPSESITVYLQEVQDPSGNQTLGRIAYYIDDEATKVNLNAASSLRSALNAAGPRPLSLSGANITTSSGESKLDQIITASSNNSSITNWGHFFRPEQAIGAGVISSNSLRSLANVTTVMPSFYTNSTTNATYTNSLYFKTPWGSDMVCINALSTNGSDGSGDLSVNFLHEALTGNKASSNTPGAGVSGFTALTSNSTYSISGQALNNVFGGNFATKYTSLGVKQIAANMLQMRELGRLAASMNKTMVEASFSYTGPLLGSGNLNSEIPAEYLGYAPYLVISEIGMSACLASGGGGGTSYKNPATNATVNVGQADWGFKLQPVIELYNPYPVPFTIPAGAFPRVMVRPSRLTCNMSWSGPNGNFSGNFAIGSNAARPSTWTYSSWFGSRTLTVMGCDYLGKHDLIFQANGNSTTIPPYSKIQTKLYYSDNFLEAFYTAFPLQPWSDHPHNSGNITIHSISDLKIKLERVILLANSGNNVGNAASGYLNTIRDWVLGDEIGELDVGFDSSKFPYEFKWNGSSLDTDPDFKAPSGANGTAAPIPTKSSQRISHLTKIPNSSNPAIVIDDSNRNWTTTNSTISGNWLASGTSWVTPTSSNFGHLGRSNSTTTDVSLAVPSASANFTTPSDPSPGDSVANAVYASTNASDMREPFLLTGNYSCPADLGLVPTNKRWRRLRMQMQPKKEVSTLYGGLGNQTYIPDWTMLDFIAFNDTGYRPTGNMTTWSQVAGEGGSYNLGTGTYDVAYGVDGRYAYKYGVTGTITFNNANFGDPFSGRGKYGYVITTTSANLTFSNASISPQIRVNPNGKFRVATGPTPAPRTVGLKSLVKTLDTTAATGNLADPMSGNSTSVGDKIRFMGDTGAASEVVAGNIANMTWSSQSTWNSRRNNRMFPSDTYLLPSEVCEIAGVSDVVDQTDYNNTNSHFKWNEGRVSAILPGLTTCSSFFTIYAYAQVLDKAGNLESEALTKTMVEVEIPIPATFSANGTIIQPAYRVKKLYTQPIALGQ